MQDFAVSNVSNNPINHRAAIPLDPSGSQTGGFLVIPQNKIRCREFCHYFLLRDHLPDDLLSKQNKVKTKNSSMLFQASDQYSWAVTPWKQWKCHYTDNKPHPRFFRMKLETLHIAQATFT